MKQKLVSWILSGAILVSGCATDQPGPNQTATNSSPEIAVWDDNSAHFNTPPLFGAGPSPS